MSETQRRQNEWAIQWSLVKNDELFLFQDWIHPTAIADFEGKDVLEGGCGGGHHTALVAERARHLVAVDLNTVDVARAIGSRSNVEFIEADLAKMNLGRQFDLVFSVGVVHHTDDPDASVENLGRHLRPGGRLILWVYSHEGNFLVRNIVEPVRKLLLRHLDRRVLLSLSKLITGLLYLPVYSAYLLPLPFLPYYEYFGNFRRLSFAMNAMNVFDKLNAPQVQFITRARAERWFSGELFEDIHISAYKGVSWRASGTRHRQARP